MKSIFLSVAVALLVLGLSSFATKAGLPKAQQGPLAVSQLTLDRAFRQVVPISGTGTSAQFPPVKGVVITEIAMEPRSAPPDLQDAVGVQVVVDGGLQTTACFLQEQWNNSSGQRCNTKDRRVHFDPPIVVAPGHSLALTLVDQSQMTMQWGPPASGAPVNFSIAGYVVYQGDV
jgi:hypothetical protein